MEKKNNVETEIQVVSKRTKKKSAVIESEISTLPIAKDAECPKCGYNEAYWVLRQTRAADEPETKIFECVKCHHKWREY